MTFFSDRPQIVLFSLLSTTKRFSFSSLKNSDDLMTFFSPRHYIRLFFKLFSSFHGPPRHPIFITAKTPFHQCTFSFITEHFVHHCTLKHACHVLHKLMVILFSSHCVNSF